MKAAAPTDLAGLARLILSKDCKSIVILTGAGVSVSAGIPDFRSPGGMYDTLKPELLTCTSSQRRLLERDPTYVVSWDIFQNNPLPYHEVRRPFILGTGEKKWKPTASHHFFEQLHTRLGKLKRVYTQNIDGLDFQTNIPNDLILPVHGSLASASCEGCGEDMAFEEFGHMVKTQIKDIYGEDPTAPPESTPIMCKQCRKPLVKPTTVLFGRSLPEKFFRCHLQDLSDADLLIIAGTSLVVSPANSLAYLAPESTIRVVVNLQPVGSDLGIDYSGSSPRDFFAQGKCDDVFGALMKEMDWVS